MKLDDYFWSWLIEAHLCGWVTENDIDMALEDRRVAYQILQDCLDESLESTGKMAQEAIRRLAEFIEQRKQNID